MNSSTLIKKDLNRVLNQNILAYWLGLQDQSHGGFYCYADFNGNIDTRHNKSVLLHTRILWSFSSAYRVFKESRYLTAARHCFDFLVNHAVDTRFGGIYWMLDEFGEVVDSQKHVYNQGFAIYALAEFYRASGEGAALELAWDLFRQMESAAYDNRFGGYIEAFDRQWNPIANHLVCDTTEELLADKSMNTHLHILEAYTNLHRAQATEAVENRIQDLLILFKEKIINASLHFGLFFNRDWTCISKDVSYGHDIEGTWLLDDAAHCLNDRQLAKEIYALTSRMAEVTLREGRDQDGAVFNEMRHGSLVDTDRIWWVQAEAMVGFYNAHQKQPGNGFLRASEACWKVINDSIIDDQNGEWHWRIRRNGQPYEQDPKVEPWKCPYHNSRACLEVYTRLAGVED